MLKVSQVANRLNCSVSTVYTLIETGQLGHHRCPGVRVSEEQLAAYLEGTCRENGSVQKQIARGRSFKQLNADRLRAAWQTQGVRALRRGGGNARSSA
jgi:excisionase family DNA binding protein